MTEDKEIEKPTELERASSLATRPPASRFRIIGGVVRALKRFQSALNPTYEFGIFKDREENPHPTPALMKGGSSRVYSTPIGTLPSSVSGRRTVSGRTSSGRPSHGGVHYGHKGNMLFKPLPDTEEATKA